MLASPCRTVAGWLAAAGWALALGGCSQTSGAASQDAAACVGAVPVAAAYGRAPFAAPLPDGGGGKPVIGQAAPGFALTDFNPSSCGHGATYGLELFRGRPTAVALWAGW